MVLSNNLTPSFIETPAFKTKLSWNLHKGNPCVEVYSSQVRKELFELAIPHYVIPNLQKQNGEQ